MEYKNDSNNYIVFLTNIQKPKAPICQVWNKDA